jgi:hypothetical protein
MKLPLLSCHDISSPIGDLKSKPEMVTIGLRVFVNRGAWGGGCSPTNKANVDKFAEPQKIISFSSIHPSIHRCIARMFATARKAAKDLISSLPINAEDNLNLPSQCKLILRLTGNCSRA